MSASFGLAAAAAAARLDGADPLAGFRARFHLPADRLYLDGNSLGVLCDAAEARLMQAVREWRTLAVEGWSAADPPWFTLAESVAAGMAPLVGANPADLAVANSTTVNLHQLLATLFEPGAGRDRVLIDVPAFPSDRYAIESHLRMRGLDPERHLATVPARADGLLCEEALIEAMDERVALAVLPSVVYTTGQLLDLPRLAEAARRRGVLLGFDCSHSAGVVRHRLGDWGVEFAFWCGYKYLNGGPGAPAALYRHPRHRDREPGLAGWFGSAKECQLAMEPAFTPAEGAGRLQIGTPPVLALAPLLGSLELLAEAGIERLREKSEALTGFLIDAGDRELLPHGFRLVTPREPERRGGHVAFAHPEAMRISAALRELGVVADHRPPDLLRLAPAPLYTTFSDCQRAIETTARIARDRLFERMPARRGLIT